MVRTQEAAIQPRDNLPYSHGKSFATLDEYLAHREALGAIDLPFYRKVPGGYVLATSGPRVFPAPERRVFTRAELAREFGFPE